MVEVEIEYSSNGVVFGKEFNELDDFVANFTSILNKANLRYVVVSGYVSILFGRSRSSEDVDMILEKINLKQFKTLWDLLTKDFECINVGKAEDAYEEYLSTGHAIHFSERMKFIPNMEVKFPKTPLDEWTLEYRKTVTVNGKVMYISPLELQIPYKLFLGSEKDIEDAKYLHNLFKGKIDLLLMEDFVSKLGVKKPYESYLK